MLRRRLPAALATGAALFALAACSTTATGTATAAGSGAAASGGSSSGGSTGGGGGSMPAASDLASTVKQAALAANAVHIKGQFTDSGSKETLDIQLNKNGDASGSVSQGDTQVPITVVNKVYYLQFTSSLEQAGGLDPSSSTGAALLNKWVPSTSKLLSGSDMVDSFKQATDYNTLVPQLFDALDDTESPKDNGTSIVDGYPVHIYKFDDGSEADVATADPHYLIRLVEPADQGSGSLDFTGWNKQVTISAPPASDIYNGPGA
jgi:hypothetical protein